MPASREAKEVLFFYSPRDLVLSFQSSSPRGFVLVDRGTGRDGSRLSGADPFNGFGRLFDVEWCAGRRLSTDHTFREPWTGARCFFTMGERVVF